jgi:hypothetical protein
MQRDLKNMPPPSKPHAKGDSLKLALKKLKPEGYASSVDAASRRTSMVEEAREQKVGQDRKENEFRTIILSPTEKERRRDSAPPKIRSVPKTPIQKNLVLKNRLANTTPRKNPVIQNSRSVPRTMCRRDEYQILCNRLKQYVWWVDPRVPGATEIQNQLRHIDVNVSHAKTASVDVVITNYPAEYKPNSDKVVKIWDVARWNELADKIKQSQRRPTLSEVVQTERTHGPSTAQGQSEVRYHYFKESPYILAEDVNGDKRPILNREWPKHVAPTVNQDGETFVNSHLKPYPVIYWDSIHFGKCPFTWTGDLPEDFDRTETDRLRTIIERASERHIAKEYLRKDRKAYSIPVNRTQHFVSDAQPTEDGPPTASGIRSTTSRVPGARDNVVRGPNFNTIAIKRDKKAKKIRKRDFLPAYMLKPGYCEHCSQRYEKYSDHIHTPLHLSKINTPGVWDDLDKLKQLVQQAVIVNRPFRDPLDNRGHVFLEEQLPEIWDEIDSGIYETTVRVPIVSEMKSEPVEVSDDVMEFSEPLVPDIVPETFLPEIVVEGTDSPYHPRSRSPTRDECMAHEAVVETANCSMVALPTYSDPIIEDEKIKESFEIVDCLGFVFQECAPEKMEWFVHGCTQSFKLQVEDAPLSFASVAEDFFEAEHSIHLDYTPTSDVLASTPMLEATQPMPKSSLMGASLHTSFMSEPKEAKPLAYMTRWQTKQLFSNKKAKTAAKTGKYVMVKRFRTNCAFKARCTKVLKTARRAVLRERQAGQTDSSSVNNSGDMSMDCVLEDVDAELLQLVGQTDFATSTISSPIHLFDPFNHHSAGTPSRLKNGFTIESDSSMDSE